MPVVNDALVLPPPATGSQYAWKRNWGGSSSPGGGGDDGGGGGGERCTRADWVVCGLMRGTECQHRGKPQATTTAGMQDHP